MFLLFGTTFLELSAFLIIVYLIFTFWKKWNSKYKLIAIISLLITGIFFIKNPRNQGVSRFQSGEELVNSVGK